MGADNNPDAAYHLRLARQQLEEGKKLIGKKDNLEASYVLKRSVADGELAMAVTEYGSASTEAEQARARVQALRERTNTNTPTPSINQSPTIMPPATGDQGNQTHDMSNDRGEND